MKSRTLSLTCALMLAITGAVAAQQLERTEPATTSALADSSSELAVAGTVVSSTSTELVIDTDAGRRMTFALDPATAPGRTFTPGERVSVQYHSQSGGTVNQIASITVPPAEVTRRDPTTRDSSRLPATASALPWIGLLGLLAAGGAVAVRVARS